MSESSKNEQPIVGATTGVTTNASTQRQRLGDLLVNAVLAERTVIEQIAADARAHNERLGESLTRHGVVEPIDVYRALAAQWRLPFSTVWNH